MIVGLRVSARLATLVTSIDAIADRLARRAAGVFLWPPIYAIALGSGAFVIRNSDWFPALEVNRVSRRDAYQILLWVAAAAVAVAACLALAIARAGGRGEAAPGRGEAVAAFNRRLRPLLALPLVAALLSRRIESEHPKETFFLIALVAVVVGMSAYVWPRSGSEVAPSGSPLGSAAQRRSAGGLVALLWIAYGAFFSFLSITNHHALNTRTRDLGYYDNILYQSAHGHPLACSFIKAGYHGSAHFDPILVLLSPLYLFYPHAELLLILQSFWLGAGVVPVYLIARDRLGSRGAALTLAGMYAIYPALHGANLYDFHSLTLLTPIALWLLYLLEKGAWRAYWLVLAAALFVREDVALLMCFVGAYAIAARRPRWTRLGWITIAVSLSYFAIVKHLFMTSSDILNAGGSDSYSFAYYYDDLIPNHNGVSGILISLLTNPIFVGRTMLTEPKILYLLTLFLPLAFLPCLARPGRMMLIWGLIFSLLASRAPVYSAHFQYSSFLIPILFAVLPAALCRIETGARVRGIGMNGARLSRALLLAAFAASLLVSWKFGGIVDNQAFKGGFRRVARGLSPAERDRYAWVRAQTRALPAAARVGLTDRTGAHASNRIGAFEYPAHQDVDWLFVDETDLVGADLEQHTQNVRSGRFVLMAKYDSLAVYKKGVPVPAQGPTPTPK